jgi:hypothetical protein
MLSYELADVLVSSLFRDYQPRWLGWDNRPREQLMAFLREAHFRDAGQLAAEEHLGIRLGDHAAKFLGPGNWNPRDEPFDEAESTAWVRARKDAKPQASAGRQSAHRHR